MVKEKEDLIVQFFADADASAEDKETLDNLLNVAPLDPQLRRLVLILADWCYDEGHDDSDRPLG